MIELIVVSWTCFEHPSGHCQEDLYMQFYGISLMHPYGLWSNYCFYFDAGQLDISQYREGPATGHLDTGFSWFPWVQERMLRWFPPFQVVSTCFSCSPPDLYSVVTNCLLSYYVKWPLPQGDNPTAVNKYYFYYYYKQSGWCQDVTWCQLVSSYQQSEGP
jgi:hypothetical protein